MWILSVALAATPQPTSFEQAVQHAVAHNLELAQQRRGNAVVRYQLNSARAGFDPRLQVDVSVDQAKNPSNELIDIQGDRTIITTSGTSVSAGLSQQLPSGGSVSLSVSEFQSTTDSANALFPRFISNRAGVNLNQPLLRGFGFGPIATLRDAQLDLAAQEIVWRQQLESAVIDIARSYWGLVSAREQAEIATRGVELAERQLAETLERFEAGFAGTGDVLQVRVSLGQAERSQVDARASVELAEARLARLMGLDLTDGAAIEPTDEPAAAEQLPDFASLMEAALARNARYALATVDRERAARSARRSRNQALPDLGLRANAGWSTGGTDAAAVRSQLLTDPAPTYGMGVSLGLPVIPRQARAQYGLARLREEQADLALRAARQDLELDVRNALATITRDVAGLDTARQTLEHARASLAAQRELLDEGRGSTWQVVDALNSLRSAEVFELEARIRLQLALLEAQRIAGDLLTVDDVRAAAAVE